MSILYICHLSISVIEESRVSVVDGRPLPAARSISLLVFQERELLSPAVTLMHMTFGQLLDHDIGRTAVAKLAINVSRTGNANKNISHIVKPTVEFCGP